MKDDDISPFWLVDSAGDYLGIATWAQVAASLAASPEGWIAVAGGREAFVEGNEETIRAAYKAWCAS